MNRNAVTLMEILLAAFLMTIMSGAIYGVLSRSSYTRAMATARATAKDEVEKALRQLERDISMARANSFNDSTAGKLTMKITQKDVNAPATGGSSYKEADVEYSYGAGVLSRKTTGGFTENIQFTRHLKDLQTSRNPSGSGTVYLKMVTSVPPEGFPDAPQEHSQDILISIREESAGAGSDTRWVKPNALKNQF